ncbi:unnamed protein product [Caenorhabditis angaria]|uniref:Uncharacterized protein n=1 Tax=Caenorhabditis angaria TaxID=860376 RepID=A0A9P1I937_9PELO|nr:unnamed protein product [Caenorhabditis angaria]
MQRNIMHEINDSVSRMIDNIGFTEVTRGAHNKLVRKLIEIMQRTTGTLKMFMENADIQGDMLRDRDLMAVLKFENVNIPKLMDYMKQVLPFPPEEEIEEDVLKNEEFKEEEAVEIMEVDGNQNKIENEKEEEVQVKKRFEDLPKFDDQNAIDLGFICYKPVILPLPQAVFKNRNPAAKFSTSVPDLHRFSEFPAPTFIVPTTKTNNNSRSSTTSRKPRGSYTAKRNYLKKHENRLRLEQNAQLAKEKMEEQMRRDELRSRLRRKPEKKFIECEKGRLVMRIPKALLPKPIPKIKIRYQKLSKTQMKITSITTQNGYKKMNVLSKVTPRNAKN